jgi:hypothetical protein
MSFLSDLFGGGKTPSEPALPVAPNMLIASNTASTAQTAARAAALQSGGLTDYTDGTGIVLGSDVSKATIVGS